MRRTPHALTGLTLIAALALTGCGTADTDSTPAASADAAASSAGSEPSTAAPASPSSAAATSATSATATSAPTGGARDGSTASGSSTSAASSPISEEFAAADAMFAQMMIPHHEQALEMSRIVLGKEGVPEDVRRLAEQIEAAQGPEIARMQDMLATWGVTDAQPMDHSGHGGMAGMLSEEQLQDLRDAEGPEAARLFLEGMVDHHEGAVDMAQQHLENGVNPQARALSEDVVAVQEREIAQMEDMLADL